MNQSTLVNQMISISSEVSDVVNAYFKNSQNDANFLEIDADLKLLHELRTALKTYSHGIQGKLFAGPDCTEAICVISRMNDILSDVRTRVKFDGHADAVETVIYECFAIVRYALTLKKCIQDICEYIEDIDIDTTPISAGQYAAYAVIRVTENPIHNGGISVGYINNMLLFTSSAATRFRKGISIEC